MRKTGFRWSSSHLKLHPRVMRPDVTFRVVHGYLGKYADWRWNIAVRGQPEG